MVTKLEKTLKREIEVNGEPYVLTISPAGLKLVPKGKRKGQELAIDTGQDTVLIRSPFGEA